MPLVQEFLGTLGEAGDVLVLGEHHDPADGRHDAEDADHDPGVDGDRFDQVAEEAEAIEEANLGGLGLAHDEELRVLLTLSERGDLDESGSAGSLGNFHFIELAGKAGLSVAIPADEGGTVQRWKSNRKVGNSDSIDVERGALAIGNEGEMPPGTGGKRSRARSALRPGRTRDLHEGNTVIQTNTKSIGSVLAAVDGDIRHHGGWLDEGHPGVRCCLQNRGIRIGWDADRLLSIQFDTSADHRSIDRDPGILGADATSRGITWGRSVLVEMINRHRVAVVGGLRQVGLLTLGRFLFLVTTRVEVDVAGCSRLQIGDLHPDESLVHDRVELLDLRGEQGLVIGVDEAKVAAVLLGIGEVEVTVMKADDHRGGSNRIGDSDTVVGGVDRDLFAGAPSLIPPCAGIETSGRHDHER